MQKTYNVYHNLGYWFMLFIILVFGGFYTTYLSVIFDSHPPLIHIHFALMTMWIVMLIAQPFLIKFKKLSIHRALGKISYVLVPLVLLSAFLMIRLSYYKFIRITNEQVTQGLNKSTGAQVLQQAADFQAIAVFYFFLVCYFLFARDYQQT